MAALLLLLNQLCGETNMIEFLASFLLLSIFVLFLLPRSSGKVRLPPSPTRLPIIGNLHQLGKFPHRSLQALSNKYGPLMLLHFGQVPTLVVSSAELSKEVMKTHDTVFCSRPRTTAAKMLLYDCQDLAFSPYGDYWRQVRKICVVELLSLKRVQQFQYARKEEVADLVSRIREASHNESPINLSEMMVTTSGNIISRCIIGQKFVEENGNWFGEVARSLTMQLMAFSLGDFYPCLRWIDNLTGLIAGMKKTSVKLDGFFDQLIEEHKTRKREDEHRTGDFVDILLKLQNDDMLNFELTRNNLKAIIQDMFVAGIDSTSTTLEWLMAELARNPSVMEKIQQEVRRVVGEKANIDESDINQMQYLKCVIKETLRLHPPGPLLLPRETTGEVTLGGFHVPAKTRVLVNAFAVQRDPMFWDKPDEFLPGRFEDSSIDSKCQDFQYFPFGGGRRGCPGQAFAVAALEYVIANLLYWFEWNLPNGNLLAEASLDMSEVHGLTVSKKAPLYLVPKPYSF